MTGLKGRCTKGWRRVRDVGSPSLFSLRALIPFWDGSMCDPKCEGSVRDIYSPSRPSNALYIRVWMARCEYVRVKSRIPLFFALDLKVCVRFIVSSPKASDSQSVVSGLAVRPDGLINAIQYSERVTVFLSLRNAVSLIAKGPFATY